MADNNSPAQQLFARELTDVLIRVGIIAFLVVLCANIFAPFASLMAWALILAITLYPLHQSIARRLGGSQGRASTLIVIVGLLLLGVPTVMLGSSYAGHLHDFYAAFQSDGLKIAPPAASVAEWPLVGERVYAVWGKAAEDLPGLLQQNRETLAGLARTAVATAAATAGSILAFLGSLIIAGIMMAYGESGHRAMGRIFVRLTSPERGPRLQKLFFATVRSVASGVIGVAFIQAVLLGVGFMWAGIPGAGVLAFIVLLLGIAQLPALLVSLPAVAYVWVLGDASTTMNVVYSVYILVAGFADNVLKPLLLGRGVEAPMPVILIGALGGMVTSGMIGLFMGAVVLAVGYQLFMDWVANPVVQDSLSDEANIPNQDVEN